jgi:hypothetical protein
MLLSGGEQRALLLSRDADAELMDGHRPPLRVPGIGRVKLSQRRHAAVAFQHAEVGSDQGRLKDAVIARDGIEQRLEFRELFQHGGNLFFIGPGR